MEMYNQFRELMNYYYLDFNIYYFCILILLINVLKYVFLKPEALKNISKILLADIIISLSVIVGIGSGAFFQGALTDISVGTSNPWMIQMLIIVIISIMLFFMQLLLYAKKGHGK